MGRASRRKREMRDGASDPRRPRGTNVVVYHGTAVENLPFIAVDGLVPAPARDRVYLTTSYELAVAYAKGWALYHLKDHDGDGIGVVFALDVPRASLVVDPDDPRPEQFIVNGNLGRRHFRDHELIEFDFTDPEWDEIAEGLRDEGMFRREVESILAKAHGTPD